MSNQRGLAQPLSQDDASAVVGALNGTLMTAEADGDPPYVLSRYQEQFEALDLIAGLYAARHTGLSFCMNLPKPPATGSSLSSVR